MQLSAIDTQVRTFLQRYPMLWAVVNLLISIYGIIFMGWNIQPVVYLFWIEVILNVASALVRAMGAMSSQPFADTIAAKLGALAFGTVMGLAFIMLSVAFTIKGFEGSSEYSGLANVGRQSILLALNYGLAILFHYFLNGEYKTATPGGEIMGTFMYLLILLCLIMAVTMHLLPKFPQLNQARWVAASVVLIKFGVDYLRVYFTKSNLARS